MHNIKLNIDHIFDFLGKEEIYSYQEEINQHHQSLIKKTGKGNDFLGWVDLPVDQDPGILDRIEADAMEMIEKVDLFVVIGIGGSYLGARAVIEALSPPFAYLDENRKYPQVIYAGHHIGEDYLADLLRILDEKEYALTVISKSGTTTEPAIAFRLLKNHLENKYGKEEARKRIIAITDGSKGALKKLAGSEGYRTYVVPDDVGGRYSVLTPVGLLPIAVAGYDIRSLIKGAAIMQQVNASGANLDKNPSALYAAARNALYKKGKTVEILVNYLPSLYYFTEWWKQLYGESEGKENKGIFPAGVGFTSDLHSMGQYIQEGLRMIFETVLTVEKTSNELRIPEDNDNLDGLNYIAGEKIEEVNRMAGLGTMLAHVDGGVPNLSIQVPDLDEYNLGQLIYFFETGCALCGYTLGVNPFDQPGVEAYKRNMFALLGKPGFEEETKKLRERL